MIGFLVVSALVLKAVLVLAFRRQLAAWWRDRREWKRQERDAQRNIDQGAT